MPTPMKNDRNQRRITTGDPTLLASEEITCNILANPKSGISQNITYVYHPCQIHDT